MILTLPDSFIIYFLSPLVSSPFCFSLWFCALVICPFRLHAHCEAEEQRDGSNSFCATPQARLHPPPSAHYLQTRLGVSAGRHSLLLGPRPAVLQGAEVSGRPTSESVSATRKHPGHSTPVHLQENCKINNTFSQTWESVAGFSLLIQKETRPNPKKINIYIYIYHCPLELLHLF